MKPKSLEQIYKEINRLKKLGVELFIEKDKLKYKATSDILDEETMRYLKENKKIIYNFLAYSDYDNNIDKIISEKLNNNLNSFNLTDIQRAYMLGRNKAFEYSGVGCHVYIELEYDYPLDYCKVNEVWNQLIKKHEMLRMEINKEGKQSISDYLIKDIVKMYNLKNDYNILIDDIRRRYSQKIYDLSKAPLFDIGIIKNNEKNILFLSIDLMIADWRSVWRLIYEFEQMYFYNRITESPDITFKDHVLSLNMIKESFRYYNDRDYWMNKIKKISDAPQVPRILTNKEINTEFSHYSFSVERNKWNKIIEISARKGLTPTIILLSVYSSVLRKWSENKDFTLNLTVLNREQSIYSIDEVIGDFTGLTLLECKDDYGLTFCDYAKKLQEELIKNLEHKSFSGVEVLRELSIYKKENNILMPYVFTSGLGLFNNNEYIGKMNDQIRSQTPQVFVDCQCMEDHEGIKVFFDIRKGIFSENTIKNLINAFYNFLQKLDKEEVWNKEINIELPEEDFKIINSINDNNKYLNLKTIDKCIYEQYLKTPNKIALIDGNEKWTYKELIFYANKIRYYIDNLQIEDNSNIGVNMSKSIFQIATTLGILFSGKTYVPIELDLPYKRRKELIRQAKIKLVFNNVGINNEDFSINIDISKIFEDRANHNFYNKDIVFKNCLDDSAYIIFTSGTTGTPKGVEVSHRSVMNTIIDINEKFDISGKDVFLNISKLSFDLSIYDIFASLISGGTLVIPKNDSLDSKYWYDLIQKYNITVWNTVPAIMQLFLNYLVENKLNIGLKKVFLSGDWIPIELPNEIRTVTKECIIVALGGATEASIWSNYHICKSDDIYLTSIPYGKALSNQKLYVLDNRGEYCPLNVVGELYIGGTGLAKGYIYDKKLTESAFIEKDGIRLYKTGDFAKVIDTGEIEFLGRKDRQVKLNGFRIELAEIENKIKEISGVKSAVVLLNSNGLLSAMVISDNPSKLNVSKIEKHLNEELPKYMIPKIIFIETKIPLTNNGKIDYKLLEETLCINGNKVENKESLYKYDSLTQYLIKICKSRLNVTKLSEYDNLYNLGADSLIMAELAGNIREYINVLEGYKTIEFDKLLREMMNRPKIYDLRRFIETYKDSKENKNSVSKCSDDSIGQINFIHQNSSDVTQVFLHAGFGTLNCYKHLFNILKKDNISNILGISIKNSEKYCKIKSEELISKLANEYSKKIEELGVKKVQIIGYCISGLIAVDMARILKQNGKVDCSVILIDSHPIKYKIDDDILIEMLFLPSLGISFEQLGFKNTSNEELFEGIYYLYNKFNKEIPSKAYTELNNKYPNIFDSLIKLDNMGKNDRFILYKEKIKQITEDTQPIEMSIELYKSFKHSLRAAAYTPKNYIGNINFLLARISSGFIKNEDCITLKYWEKVCLGSVNVVNIPGDHITCTENYKNAIVLADIIKRLLIEFQESFTK